MYSIPPQAAAAANLISPFAPLVHPPPNTHTQTQTHLQPALSFIEPTIEINAPGHEMPRHDLTIPILPTPKVGDCN